MIIYYYDYFRSGLRNRELADSVTHFNCEAQLYDFSLYFYRVEGRWKIREKGRKRGSSREVTVTQARLTPHSFVLSVITKGKGRREEKIQGPDGFFIKVRKNTNPHTRYL